MQVPLELSFHQIDKSDFLEDHIRDSVENLERYFDNIIACRVVVEAPHRSPHSIKHVRVRIDLTIPGRELIAESQPTQDEKNKDDVYFAVDEAFEKMERQLRKFADELNEDRPVAGNEPMHGVIAKIFPDDVNDEAHDEGYGFVESIDGRELYFRESAVDGINFEELEPGMKVKFHERAPDTAGPSSVAVNIQPVDRLKTDRLTSA